MHFLATGDHGTVAAWLEALPDETLLRDARVCVVRAFVALSKGQMESGNTWLERAQQADLPGPFTDGCGSLAAVTAYLLSGIHLGRGALNDSRSLARKAVDLLEESSPHRQVAFATLGLASYLLGHTGEAVDALEASLRQGRIATCEIGGVHVLGWLASVRADMGQWDQAGKLASKALAIGAAIGAEEHWWYGLALNSQGRVRAWRGQIDEAEVDLVGSIGLLRRGLPVFLAYVLPDYARFRHSRGYVEEARALISEARSLVQTFPDPGTLPMRVKDVERSLSDVPCGRPAPTAEPLSERELSVLRLLRSTLSQREIAGELYVSMNTVKSHSRSIFRKLGVSTRSEAVSRAQDLALL